MKTSTFVALAVAFLAAAIAIGVYGWIGGGGAEIGFHGWAALALGVVFSIVVGGGLMALVFISSRRGYDEAVQFEDDTQA